VPMNKTAAIKTPAEWTERAAAFVAALNPSPEHQIGYYGDDPKEIVHYLLEEAPEVMERSAIVVENGELVGFLGSESDAEVGRTWLYGPTTDHPDPDAVADALFDVVRPLLPADARQHELFFNVANKSVQRFGERHGFDHYKDAELLRFRRPSVATLPPSDARAVSESETLEVATLHDRLFPTAPWAGRQVMERRGEYETVLVLEEEGRLLGYIHTRVNPKFPEGNIEFVGVVEEARGKGAGTRLLAGALHWMFSFPHIDETWLTVMDDNPSARSLYVKLGFEPVHLMRGMRTPSSS
jgi:ribosomal protein S18 acetylase RimI-like enzyme